MKTTIRLFLTFLCLSAAGFKAQAVLPPPDGGYPNFTTAEGDNALQSLTTGLGNTGMGWFALFANTTGSFNTAVGAGALDLNTGNNNTATGAAALLLNTNGTNNTANGVDALAHNDIGNDNTATGSFALFSNTGIGNTANGFDALFGNTTGTGNTAIGTSALFYNTTGGDNTANGFNALRNNTTGSGNVALGAGAGSSVATANDVTCIGAGVGGEDVPATTWIGSVYATSTVSGTTLPVIVSDGGQLGTASSSLRFKKEIKPMDQTSEAILALNPVTFHYKSDKTSAPQFGLVAEDVAKVNPDLVVRDKNGEIYTVRYDAVNAMLLNEFLKEHRTVQEQGAMIACQQKQIEALTAGLQKVGAQLEVSKPARQTVLNSR